MSTLVVRVTMLELAPNKMCVYLLGCSRQARAIAEHQALAASRSRWCDSANSIPGSGSDQVRQTLAI